MGSSSYKRLGINNPTNTSAWLTWNTSFGIEAGTLCRYGWQLVNQVEKEKQTQERHADGHHRQHHFFVYQATQYVHVSPP
jgi:hypothetical protein